MIRVAPEHLAALHVAQDAAGDSGDHARHHDDDGGVVPFTTPKMSCCDVRRRVLHYEWSQYQELYVVEDKRRSCLQFARWHSVQRCDARPFADRVGAVPARP